MSNNTNEFEMIRKLMQCNIASIKTLVKLQKLIKDKVHINLIDDTLEEVKQIERTLPPLFDTYKKYQQNS